MENFLEKEIENRMPKMDKVFGDQHPYNFYVTAGHDFEDFILKKEDYDAPGREDKKKEPFLNLKKMSEVDKKAEQEFYELLSKMAEEAPTSELKEALEEKKKECSKVFVMFDQIVELCKNNFELEYSDCIKRVSKQMTLQEPITKEVEKYLTEVEDVGNAELKSLRDKISKWMYDKGLEILNSIGKSHETLGNQPSAMAVCLESSASLTSKEVRSAFLADQKDMGHMWKKSFDDLLMLSTKLEEYRCNYNQMKFKLERDISWMSRDYKEKMPELIKIQRRLANMKAKNAALKAEVKNLESEIKSEKAKMIKNQNRMNERINSARNYNKLAHQKSLKESRNVIQIKKEEIYHSLSEILKGDQYIHEEILGVSWNPVDLSHLKPEDDDKDIDATDEVRRISTVSLGSRSKNFSANFSEEDFSDAFQLVSSENFVTLLNAIAEELGCKLDFKWVDYIKSKLKLSQDVKWIELFKVFNKNAVEDLKELKNYMKSYCKLGADERVVFDVNGVLDGFLNFVWMKRQSSTHRQVKHRECDTDNYKDYLVSATNAIPKTLLWDGAEEILFQYRRLLEVRSELLKTKFSLVEENKEFDKCLANYHKYST